MDREKVIKGIQECDLNGGRAENCPYKDILFLLKEQETEWEHLWDAPDGTFKGRCKKCGFVHFFIEGHDSQYNFCPECGRKVKWE